MGSTEISAEQTVGEIQRLLGQSGASAILMDYENGEIAAVSFKYRANGVDLPFRLPCRWKAVYEIMMKEKSRPRYGQKEKYESQAKRVAWRQILRWIQAQMAIVETGMVKIQEVFFPYIQDKSGQTIYEKLESRNFNLQLEHHS